MKIVTVCGLGVGSSLILKMTVSSALARMNKKATIEHWDMGTIKGQSYDLLVTTEGFRKNFASQDNVIYVDNIVNVDEVTEKLREYFEKQEVEGGQ